MHWRKFFKQYGNYVVPARYYENTSEMTVDDLYEAFRARMKDEAEEARCTCADETAGICPIHP